MPARPPARQARRRRGRVLRWLGLTALVLFVVAIVGIFAAYQWVKAFVRGEEFRQLVESNAAGFLHAEVELHPLEWDRLNVRTAKITATGSPAFTKLTADDLRGTITLGGLTRGVWTITGARVENLVIDFKQEAGTPAGGTPGDAPGASETAITPSLPGWMQTEIEVPEVRIRNTNLRFGSGDADFRILGSTATLASRPDGDQDLDLRGGYLVVSPFPGGGRSEKTFTIRDASARISPTAVYIVDSRMVDEEGTFLAVEGTVPHSGSQGAFDLHTKVASLPVSEALGPEWTNRVFGRLAMDFRSHHEGDELVHEGTVQLEDARLVTPQPTSEQPGGLVEQGWRALSGTLMPVLGAYTEKTRQFRNIIFNEAGCRFRKTGEKLLLRDIRLLSRGLLAVEGDLEIIGDRLDGLAMVGVTRATLAGIPGAESKVFTTERDGYLWTPVRISGTLDAPAEDLTGQLVAAAGERILEAVPELGLGTLNQIIEGGGRVIEGGAGILEQGAEAAGGLIEGGSGLLQQGSRLIPVPGARRPVPTPPRPEPEETEAVEDEAEKPRSEDASAAPAGGGSPSPRP